MAQDCNDLKELNRVSQKPEPRAVAERSIMSALTFASTVASTHYIPVEDAACAQAPPADNFLAKAVHDYHVKAGAAGILTLNPELIVNIDSETMMVHTRKEAGGSGKSIIGFWHQKTRQATSARSSQRE